MQKCVSGVGPFRALIRSHCDLCEFDGVAALEKILQYLLLGVRQHSELIKVLGELRSRLPAGGNRVLAFKISSHQNGQERDETLAAALLGEFHRDKPLPFVKGKLRG